MNKPAVSIIIPHWRGREILFRCLDSLAGASLRDTEVLLVDNGSTDGSVQDVPERFPAVLVVRSEHNLGYAGGCNLGLKEASGRYALLLNDDAVVTPGFLGPMVGRMDADPTIAACQPKILSLSHPERFDYAGAAGGFVDLLGFPFCRGRIFATVEQDAGQYDDPREIFWASGACCLLRMDALQRVGFLDEEFFAHMEEIDLQWRLRLAGYKAVSVPGVVIRHDAGSTLQQDTPGKVYLNHRNNLLMLAKNYTARSLLTLLPLRIILDLVAILLRILKGEPGNAWAIIRALLSFAGRLPAVLSQQKRSAAPRIVSDRKLSEFLYRRSIVIDYFLLGKRTFSRLSDRALPERDSGV